MSVEEATDDMAWNAFVRRRRSPAFTRWEWGTLSETYGHERIYLQYARDGDVLGCLPLVHLDSPLFGSKLVSMPFAEYGGTIVNPGEDDVRKILRERAVEIAEERDVDYLLLRGIDADTIQQPFVDEQQYVTFELSLHDGTRAVWDSFESRLRRAVRKARKNDVETIRATTHEGVRRYYDLFLKTMRGHGTPPHSMEFFSTLQSTLGDAGDAHIYLAINDGTAINGAVIIYGVDTAYYWSGASDYDYRDLNGGSLLLWNAICDAEEESYSTFNLGRTREESGVYTYKKGFNGQKVPLTDAYYFPRARHTSPDPVDDKYDIARRAWQRLPLVVTKYLGPPIRKHFP